MNYKKRQINRLTCEAVSSCLEFEAEIPGRCKVFLSGYVETRNAFIVSMMIAKLFAGMKPSA